MITVKFFKLNYQQSKYDRFGVCHWQKGDKCKVTDKEYYGN